MKRHLMSGLQLLVTVMLSLFLTNCDKEKCTRSYTLYDPIYTTLTRVRANMKSNPAQALKNPGKIYIYGTYIFLNESNEGIHIIDNSNPAVPKNIAFVNIPGNVDLAVKDNTLFADSYSDLVAFDISNPLNVTAKKFVNNAFPYRNMYYAYYGDNVTSNPDSIRVIIGWKTHDTIVNCPDNGGVVYNDYVSLASSSAGGYSTQRAASGGQGGSMARFTLMNDYLYTVSYSELFSFDISTPADPKYINKSVIAANQMIETIYPFKNKLFIGSTNGMYIYDVSTPGSPVKQGTFTHVRSCDPVIADDNRAWVTLRNGNTCGGTANSLEVVDITDLTKPALLKTYGLTNPFGLSKEGNILFVCDGKDGIKVYNATDANDIKLIKQITGMETYDVIAWNNRALVVAKDGLYQFDYSDVNNIRLLSKINLQQ
jgi:hypothetical protein